MQEGGKVPEAFPVLFLRKDRLSTTASKNSKARKLTTESCEGHIESTGIKASFLPLK